MQNDLESDGSEIVSDDGARLRREVRIQGQGQLLDSRYMTTFDVPRAGVRRPSDV